MIYNNSESRVSFSQRVRRFSSVLLVFLIKVILDSDLRHAPLPVLGKMRAKPRSCCAATLSSPVSERSLRRRLRFNEILELSPAATSTATTPRSRISSPLFHALPPLPISA